MKRFNYDDEAQAFFLLASSVAMASHQHAVRLIDLFRAARWKAESALKRVFGCTFPPAHVKSLEGMESLPLSQGAEFIFSRYEGEIQRVADAIRPFSDNDEPLLGVEHVVAGLALAAAQAPESNFAKTLNRQLEKCGQPPVDNAFVERMLATLAAAAERKAINLKLHGDRRAAFIQAMENTLIGNRRAYAALRRRITDALSTRNPLPTVLLGVGPDGSGRRFLAETAAKALAEGRPVIHLDFSLLSRDDLAMVLTGLGHSWQGGGKAGLVTGPALQVPRPVYLIENIDRASANAIAVLVRIFATGRAFDAYHEKVAFFNDATFFVLVGKPVDDEDLLHALGGENAPQYRQTEMVVARFPQLAPLASHATVLLTARCTVAEALEGAQRAIARQCDAFRQALGVALDVPEALPRLILDTLPALSVGMATRAVEELFSHLRDETFDALRDRKGRCLVLRVADEVPLPPASLAAFERHTKRRIARAKRGVFGLRTVAAPELTLELTLRHVTLPCVEDCGFFSVRPAAVSWNDLVGVDHVRQEICATLDYLSLPAEARAKRLSPPTGMLLYGPPGTGKTMIAKAAASTLGVAFIYVSAADFLGKDATAVHELFATANHTKAILFIDEVDSLGSRESNGFNTVTINAFLTELDGYAKRDFLVIGATNYPNRLDPALCRDGRLGKRIYVGPCSRREDVALLIRKLLAKAACPWGEATVDFLSGLLTNRTPSAICAAVGSVVNALGAKENPSESALLCALNTEGGSAPEASLEKRHRVAIHEAGHATVCLALGIAFRQICVIEKRSMAGFVEMATSEALHTLEHYRHRICVALGGALAEELCLRNTADGTSRDFEIVRDLALNAPAKRLSADAILYGDEYKQKSAHALIDAMLATTRTLLARERPFLDALVARLLRDRVCSERDALELWQAHHPKRSRASYKRSLSA